MKKTKPATLPRFIGANGKVIPASKRYSGNVERVQVFRRGRWVTVIKGHSPTSHQLAQVLNRREFELLPEALKKVQTYESKSKYKAWDIAAKIDETKGIRRKDLKITMEIIDGKRKKKVSFYQKIKRNAESSYSIFRRINQEVGLEGFFLYSTANGKHIADRRGKKVKLGKVTVEQIL